MHIARPRGQPDRMPPAALISTGDELLHILSEPEAFALPPHTWLALSADDALVAQWPAHTLAGRLCLSPDALNTLAREAKLWGALALRWSSFTRKLSENRHALGLPTISFTLVADDGGVRWLWRSCSSDEVHALVSTFKP